MHVSNKIISASVINSPRKTACTVHSLKAHLCFSIRTRIDSRLVPSVYSRTKRQSVFPVMATAGNKCNTLTVGINGRALPNTKTSAQESKVKKNVIKKNDFNYTEKCTLIIINQCV